MSDNCGTTAGYQAHRARGDRACDACKDARAAAEWSRTSGRPAEEWSRRRPRWGDPLAWLRDVVANPPEGCALWPFARGARGYGSVHFGGRAWPAHRLALVLSSGQNPEGLDAAHAPLICHQRLCVNPPHLRWATRAENAADTRLDGTWGRKLSAADVRVIRALSADGARQVDLAARFGVTQSSVSDVVRRLTWVHVP